jgi:hypothetical protein
MTSSTEVPAQPPSANELWPPRKSTPPPRLDTKSAIIWSWSCVKNDASALPITSARYR